MLWVWVVLGIGVLGLVGCTAYAVRLARRTAVLTGELADLAERGAELAELAAQVEVPSRWGGPADPAPTDGQRSARAARM